MADRTHRCGQRQRVVRRRDGGRWLGDTRRVVTDLGGVGFTDSLGISALIDCRNQLRLMGVDFTISGARDGTLRVLEMTGVLKYLSSAGDDVRNPTSATAGERRSVARLLNDGTPGTSAQGHAWGAGLRLPYSRSFHAGVASMGCSSDEAFVLLKKQSQAENLKLHEVATSIVSTAQRSHRAP